MKKGIALFIVCLLSFSVFAGSTDDEKNETKNKKKKARTAARDARLDTKARALALLTPEEEPAELLSTGLAGVNPTEEVTVKVFNRKGELLVAKKVTLKDVLANKPLVQELPQPSVFVLFHAGTAYYFMDKEG